MILARGAFGSDPDPLALFAQGFTNSSHAHVRALLLLQEAHAERLRALDQARFQDAKPLQPPQPPLPFPGALKMLGVVPADTIRFRNGAIVVGIFVAFALFGVGVLVGKL